MVGTLNHIGELGCVQAYAFSVIVRSAMIDPVLDNLSHLLSAISPLAALWIVGAIVLMRVARYGGMWIYALVAFPGTLAHELSHYLVAFVLVGHPTFPSLIPVREGRAWRLGQVQCRV